MYTIQLMSGNGMDQTTASVWAYTPVFIIEVLNSEGTNESSAYVPNNNITSAAHGRNLLSFTRNTICNINSTSVVIRRGPILSPVLK